MDAAGDRGGQHFRDAGRRRKIHVGDPHRNGVRRRDPRKLGHVIPFRRVRAAAVNDAIEIKHRDGGSWAGGFAGSDLDQNVLSGRGLAGCVYASSTASAALTASALSITVFSSEGACTEMFSAKNRASVT